MIERVAPARLGVSFRWLLASSWLSNLGDGFAVSAGPLLIASVTKSPTLVAMALLLQRLPWLLFAVFAGVLADRRSRVAIVVAVDGLRAALLAVLASMILLGEINVIVVLGAMFLIGITEVFSNTASGTLLPTLVERNELVLANSRLQTGFITVQQLVGPPIGAALFAASRSLAFIGQAILVASGAVLASQIDRPERHTGPLIVPQARGNIIEGVRWLLGNAPVRTLALTILTFNITFGAAWSVLVLYARQRLHMGVVGFGLLTTAVALGGLVGTTFYGHLTRRISLGNLLRIGLIIETLTHLALALTTSGTVALLIMFVFGAHAFVWNTTSVTVRQRAVPIELQGRVSSFYSLGLYGGLVIGAAIGGLIASRWGITSPFWFGFVGSGAITAVLWREFLNVAHEDEPVGPER